MNDDFLKALRRDPPPQFARQLKQRLQAQEAQAKRRRVWSLRALLFLIVGSSFAGGMLVLERRSAENPAAAQSQPQATAETQASAGYRPGYLSPGFVPDGNDAGSNRFAEPPPTAASSANNSLAAQPAPTTQNAASVTSNNSGPATSGGLIGARPAGSAIIAVAPLTDALIRRVLTRHTYKESEVPRVQMTAEDAAFSGLCTPPGNTRQFDVVVSSRRITKAELSNCRDNGFRRIIESKLGYQALVLTGARDSAPMKLTASDVFLALARVIPDPADPSRLIANNNITWDQVNNKLAYRPITVLGPARDTPLRLLFETLLLDPGCHEQRAIEAMNVTDPERRAELCRSVRTDRLYSEVDQNASLIPQNLWSDPHGLVLVDYAFYRENQSQLGGSAFEGPEPSYAAFVDGTYPLARPIYLYADQLRMGRGAGVYQDLQELASVGLYVGNTFGFVRLDQSEAGRNDSWRGKAPLTESDITNERSAPR